jgi:inactivated superfamily I helicase
MFEISSKPRVFGMEPGVDFAQALVDGTLERLRGQSPEAIARVEIYVNTSRMRRRLAEVFAKSPAMLLPQIKLVTDLALEPVSNIPPAVSKLRRRLELSQLVRRLLEAETSRAPRSALYDLSDSLATLMEEMHGEGVAPSDLLDLDVTDQSGHWQQSLQFISIAQRYFEADSAPDQEARQRRVIEEKISTWADAPPDHPIIVAGSTGSRGATALFMSAVAKLSQGALVLPGFDFDLPSPIWAKVEAEEMFILGPAPSRQTRRAIA